MNKRTTPQRVVERANIVLCSAEGRSGSAICREVGVSRPTVTQWLDRYEAGGVEELLEDRPRSGRPRQDHSGRRSGDRPQDPRGEARRRHALELPSHGQGSGRPSDHHLQDLAGSWTTAPPHRVLQDCPPILTSLKSCATWWVSTSIPRSGPLSSLSHERASSKPSTAPSQVFPGEKARAGDHDPWLPSRLDVTHFCPRRSHQGRRPSGSCWCHRHQEAVHRKIRSVASELDIHVIPQLRQGQARPSSWLTDTLGYTSTSIPTSSFGSISSSASSANSRLVGSSASPSPAWTN